MQEPLNIQSKAEALSAALEEHLGVTGRSLEHRIRRAGRRLPKRIRAQAGIVAQAEALSGNIKLARQSNVAQIDRAYTEVSEHLSKIDRADARRARVISILAVLAFNFIVLFAILVVFLRMRGTI